MRCIHQLRHRISLRKQDFGHLSFFDLPPDLMFEKAWDLPGLHQVRQGEKFHNLTIQTFLDCYEPRGSTIGEIDMLTRKWLSGSSDQEQRTKGILHPGLIIRDQFYSAHHLRKEKDGSWTVTLIKSGVKLKERYLQEADWIRNGFREVGIRIHLVRLLHPKKQYTRSGLLDIQEMLQEDCVTHDVKHLRRNAKDLEKRIRASLLHCPNFTELDGEAPKIVLDALCNNPDICPLCNSFYREANEALAKKRGLVPLEEQNPKEVFGYLDGSIDQLFKGGGGIRKLKDAGINRLDQLPQISADFKGLLKPRHWIQVESFRNRTPHIDVPSLEKWFNTLTWPLCFLDFESMSSSVPPFDGLQPWEHFPFGFSLCKALDLETTTDDFCYITPPGIDGRKTLVEELLKGLGTKGSVLVYGKDFELFVLKKLGGYLTEYTDALQDISRRIVDVQDVFGQFLYYHPSQGSRISLKTILPLLTSGKMYGDLQVQNGADASFGYYFLAFPEEQDPAILEQIGDSRVFLKHLDEYSRLDTLGLFRVVQSLAELIQ